MKSLASLASLVLVLALGAGQQTDSLTDAQKRVDAAAKKLVDARATTTQLVAALEAAQAGVVAANRELNEASTSLLKVQAGIRDGQLDAEQRAIDAIKSLIQPAAPVKPIKQKTPPKKGIFDADGEK